MAFRSAVLHAAAATALLAAGATAATAQQREASNGPGIVEQVAFDVRAVQSFLMVAALKCDRHEDYNRFVLRYRGDLANAWNTLEGFFRRMHGRDGQRHMDIYITALANQHSQHTMGQGGAFCGNMDPVWREAMAQTSVVALAGLTSRYSLSNQMQEVMAAAPAPRPSQRGAQR
jgi:hypothetical protein